MSNEISVIKEVRTALNTLQPDFRAVLPAHITPEAFVRVSQTAINGNPDLLRCTARSLVAACAKGAETGLLPDGEMAAIVAYNAKVSKKGDPDRWEQQAKFMPMVAGLRDLVRRSGQVKDWKVRLVYEGDEFDYVDGDEERLTHRPAFKVGAAIILVYSIAYLENGEISRNVMRLDEVEAIRKRSRSQNGGPWFTDYGEMVKKTCLRRQYKSLPRAKDDLVRQRIMSAIGTLDDADGVIDIDADTPRLESPQIGMQEAARQRLAAIVDSPDHNPETGEVHRQEPAQEPAKRTRRTSADKIAEVEAGRVARMREAEEREAAKLAKKAAPVVDAASVDDEEDAGAPYEPEAPAGFRDGVDPRDYEGDNEEEMAYRAGWHARAGGNVRTPPRELDRRQNVSAWLSGYDAFQAAVNTGRSPATPEASNEMLDAAARRAFV